MNWETVTAKNGELSLKLNGTFLYSRYHPREDAWRWIDAEFDATKKSYFLIGLGLGYHVERLLQLAQGKAVHVYYFDQKEKTLANFSNAINDIRHIDLSNGCQILIPNVWLKALGDHPLLPYLEDIKINQVTYKKTAHLLQENFEKNVQLQDFKSLSIMPKKSAVLVSSGPSLQETVSWLKNIERDVDIYVVGSALKFLLAQQIEPTAVVLSDPKSNIKSQLQSISYRGPLLYLSTTYHEVVEAYQGERHIICQRGYSSAETLADRLNLPLIETGGSVATVAFSIIEKLGYKTLILFGQDLGFVEHNTHVKGATSGRQVTSQVNVQTTRSNAGTSIYTLPNLQTYLRWFNYRIQDSSMHVYNTAHFGAQIEGANYINEQQVYDLVKNL